MKIYGYNIRDIGKQNYDYDTYVQSLENRVDELENMQRRKKRIEYHFERIMHAVDPRDYS